MSNQTTTTKTKYDGVAMTLHWLMALSILVALILGPGMEDQAPDARRELLAGHSFNGLFALTLAIIRLWWRRRNPPPAYPDTMPDWQVKAAKGVTHGFYFLFFYMPIVGIAHAVTYQDTVVEPLQLFNLTIAPSAITQVFHVMHAIGMLLFIILVVVHIAAAIKHFAIDKDKILQRMLPFTKV